MSSSSFERRRNCELDQVPKCSYGRKTIRGRPCEFIVALRNGVQNCSCSALSDSVFLRTDGPYVSKCRDF